jgi:hypothetical protein
VTDLLLEHEGVAPTNEAARARLGRIPRVFRQVLGIAAQRVARRSVPGVSGSSVLRGTEPGRSDGPEQSWAPARGAFVFAPGRDGMCGATARETRAAIPITLARRGGLGEALRRAGAVAQGTA